MIWALHGTLGSPGDWERFGQAVRGVDLYAFLESGGRGFAGFVSWLDGLVAVAGDPDPVLLGYSLGGRLALHSLLDGETRWSSAIVISAHPGLVDESGRQSRLASDRDWRRGALQDDWREFLERWDAQGVLAGSRPATDRTVLEKRRAAVAVAFDTWSLGRQENLWPRLGGIGCPVAWLVGERDRKFLEIAQRVGKSSPGIRVSVVPRAGHRVPWEAPEAVAELVAKAV